jgi:hypothetical protein
MATNPALCVEFRPFLADHSGSSSYMWSSSHPFGFVAGEVVWTAVIVDRVVG